MAQAEVKAHEWLLKWQIFGGSTRLRRVPEAFGVDFRRDGFSRVFTGCWRAFGGLPLTMATLEPA